MRITSTQIRGNVLPTVIAVSVVILTAMAGLLMLWQIESQAFVRNCRLRQARADVESAYRLYRLHPDNPALTATDGFRLYDSLPHSTVRIQVRPWGLYEAVFAITQDSLLRVCRLFGAKPDTLNTLYYTDTRTALTLAGRTELQGTLHLPQNGLIYGRMGSEFFCGREILQSSMRQSERTLPQPDPAAASRIAQLFAQAAQIPFTDLSGDFTRSFRDSTARFCIGDAQIGDCRLLGNTLLFAGELRIDSTCRIEHPVICARKVTVGAGAHIAAQIFARDTVIVEARAVLEYPSGIYAQRYAEVGEHAEVNGYVIVRDTVVRRKFEAAYRQSRTARVRGLLWVDGPAQVQGIVSGSMYLRQAAYFSPEGYYKDMFYDATLLANPHTAHPLWLAEYTQRKEAECTD